ncbi:DUF3558 family protein [Saccharomonospora xinjiangensis]|uniref:DUF3558 family protein n=1 Tax=Saccharomonospora xinjiangensis TaxID=75294 RepID=UPI001FFC9185|nr:DUF3558 family protein [Saccharomonospora xinjiangensis]
MINKLVRRSAVVATVLSLGFAAGCGGASDTGETGEAAADGATSAKPEINDPAVAAAALRTADPCALLGEETFADVGTVVEDSVHEVEWGSCSAEVEDSAGKTVSFTLRLGSNLVSTDEANEQVEGLPMEVDSEDPETCWVSIVTSHEYTMGIEFQASYEGGGDACGPAKTAMQKVVQALHKEPEQYEKLPGTTIELDPCATVDMALITETLGTEPRLEPQNLHECDMWAEGSGVYPLVKVGFYLGIEPDLEGGEAVDLGNGVSAVRVVEDLEVGCTVEWQHIKSPRDDEADTYGENVYVTFRAEEGSGVDHTAACDKATKLAQNLVSKLPKA